MNTPHPPSRPRRPASGFTLIELMVTIAVAAILMSLAAPSFRTMVMNNRLVAAAGNFRNALDFARNSSLSGNTAITVCPISADGSTTCGTAWSQGWMVLDTGAATAVTLQRTALSADGPTLRSANNAASIAFDARGVAGTTGQFVWCDSRGAAFARSTMTLPTGFVRAGAVPGTAVWDGTALTCP